MKTGGTGGTARLPRSSLRPLWHQDEPNPHPPAKPADTTRIDYERDQAQHAWRQAEEAVAPADKRRWLERAYRFTPSDQNLAFALAAARMADGDHDLALTLFSKIAARHPGREVLAGIAASALALGRQDAAEAAIARALSTTAVDRTIATLAQAITGRTRPWVGATEAGRLTGENLQGVRVLLDGRPCAPGAGALPESWRRASAVTATLGDDHILGSPIDLRAITRVEGYVRLVEGGIAGWAWQPAAPDADPCLTILRDGQAQAITATDLSVSFRGTSPLARPRGFAVDIDTARPVRVLGSDGRDLLGSPLGGKAYVTPLPRRHAPPPPDGATAVIVPVYRGLAQTMACLHAVLRHTGPLDRVIAVNDASPDPVLVAALRQLRDEGAITLIDACADDPARNLGFPAAANAGLIEAAGMDCVLLNSDTVVYPHWLATLRQAVHSAPDIGTATPFSNDATIFTYPDPANPAPMPDAAEGEALAAAALRANPQILVDVPTGHGFCLYIRAACLRDTGLMRTALFAQGYGEENDFCERARAKGWRHVAVPSVYVAHEGGVSFGTARTTLLARNGAILDQLHPSYRPRIDAFIAADPLLPARQRLDIARFTARAGAPAVLLFSHAGLGGTGRVVRERAAALRAEGKRPIVLRGEDGITQVSDDAGDTPNLRFTVPRDELALLGLLRDAKPVGAEIHHLLGHAPAIAGILSALAIPFELWVHDYQWHCARLTYVTGDGRFCGEAPVETCNACVAEWGDAQEVPFTPAQLRARGATLMARAAAVITPSADVSRRIRRHFPAAALRELPWEPDPPPRAARLHGDPDGALIVAVVGAIGMEKGYHVLLACARDAAARGLPLRFAVAGFTIDDTPLLETGHVFVTGPFKPQDARATIASLGAHLALLPSIWPETWCYALSDTWEAGLDAAVFDIGTPAERVRRTGRGWVLPLGLPAARVNDALLNLQGAASRSWP